MQQNWLILPSYTKVVRVSKLTKSRRMQSHFADPRGFEKERPSKNKAALGHIFSLLIIHFLYKMQHQKTKGFSQEKMHCKCVKYMRSNSLVFHQKSALTLKMKNSLTLLWHQDIQILFHKDFERCISGFWYGLAILAKLHPISELKKIAMWKVELIRSPLELLGKTLFQKGS